jgi:23S rRNA (uracil1939-C5)-methyltransferase
MTTAPVTKNEKYLVEITGLGHNGEGVGRVKEFTLFVPLGLPGEKILIKVIKVQKNYGFAKIEEIKEKSPHRVVPKCPIANVCGGCQIQHMDYKLQLDFKTQRVKDAIERIGKLQGVTVHNTIGMKDPYQYRNKAQFPVGIDEGELKIGFYANRSHRIIDTRKCLIQHPDNDKIIKLIRDYIKESGISIYEEATGRGLLRHIVTRKAFKTNELMVILVVNGDNIPGEKSLIDRLRQHLPELKSIVINTNRENTNVILGVRNKTLWGKDTILDNIGPFEFEISPLSFFQVNPIQTEVLYNKALEHASLTGRETVVDAYSGIGTISLFLSQKAKRVIGIEVVPDAVEDAIKNAHRNNIDNVEFIEGEAEKVMPRLYKEGLRPDVIVVDPPRKGCEVDFLETAVGMEPDRIVYVSCNPETLARDLAYLDEKGYRAIEVQPVDMFPQTSHVECCCLLSRTDK